MTDATIVYFDPEINHVYEPNIYEKQADDVKARCCAINAEEWFDLVDQANTEGKIISSDSDGLPILDTPEISEKEQAISSYISIKEEYEQTHAKLWEYLDNIVLEYIASQPQTLSADSDEETDAQKVASLISKRAEYREQIATLEAQIAELEGE